MKSIFNGLNTVACTPISPKSEFTSDAAQVCPPHDPAKAKQLLSEAGVTTPYKVTMITSNNPDSLRLAQALQAMVKEGGFELVIKPVEYASLLDQQDRGDFELLQLGWSGRVDPDANIFNFVGTDGQPERGRLQQPRASDKLLTDARQSTDQAERMKLYGQVVTKLQQDDPLIYLYRQRNLTGVSQEGLGRPGLPGRRHPHGLRRVRQVGRSRYLLGRLWQSLVTLLLATIVVFLGVRALPGDPALALAGEDRDPESLRAIREQYGLDDSLLVQFWQFVSHAARGDLGQLDPDRRARSRSMLAHRAAGDDRAVPPGDPHRQCARRRCGRGRRRTTGTPGGVGGQRAGPARAVGAELLARPDGDPLPVGGARPVSGVRVRPVLHRPGRQPAPPDPAGA